jgi:hypothetical protein
MLFASIKFQRRNFLLLTLVVFAILAGSSVIYATANGPRGGSDSMGYLSESRNILRGIGPGVFSPDGSFGINSIQPPLYPLVLAGVGLTGMDLISAARILNIVFLTAIMIILWLVFYRYSKAPDLSILVLLLLVIFPPFLRTFLTAMTESLFLFLFVAGLFCLLSHMKTGSISWLIASAIFSGLMAFTRYSGLPWLAVGAIGILVFRNGLFLKRIKPAVLFFTVSILPFLLWASYLDFHVNLPMEGKALAFSWGFLHDKFQSFRADTIGILWNWVPFQSFLPIIKSRTRSIVLFLIICGFLFLTLFAVKRRYNRIRLSKENTDFQLFTLSGFLSLALLLFLVFTYIGFVPYVRLDDRQFILIFVCAVLGAMAAFACWQDVWSQRIGGWIKFVPWLIAVPFIVWYLPLSIDMLRSSHLGIGYLSNRWRSSPTMEVLRKLPKTVPVVSNNASIILFWADHPGHEIPFTIRPDFISQTTPYGSDTSDPIQRAFHDQGGVLVIFGKMDVLAQQFENVYGTPGRLRVKTLLEGLVVSGKYPDGVIYSFPK